MKKIEKPWGYEIIWAHTDSYVGKKIIIYKGQRSSLQYHKNKEESIHIISGNLILELDGNNPDITSIVELAPGDSYHIPAMTVHRMISNNNIGETVIIEVSTNQLNDVVRIADDYGRAGVEEKNEEFI